MSLAKLLQNLSPRQLFLVDSLGALVSALLLGVLLVQLESAFGMPKAVLYKLAFTALGFACYSFLCYRLFPANWPLFMRLIAVINLLYCGVTLVLVFYYQEVITRLGYLYFVGEIIIVSLLAILELKTARTSSG